MSFASAGLHLVIGPRIWQNRPPNRMRLRGGPVPEAVSQTMLALCVVTQNLPIGTNLGLLHFLWMLLSDPRLGTPL
jgi:hypothetical protein